MSKHSFLNQYTQATSQANRDKQLQKSLEALSQWIASKSQSLSPAASNVLLFKPKALAQKKIEPFGMKSLKIGFFALKKSELLSPTPHRGSAKQKEQEKQKQPQIDASCNNCGGLDHNSMACVKPRPTAGKR